MAEVARKYPNDVDAGALYAESLMDLRPWNYWTPEGIEDAGLYFEPPKWYYPIRHSLGAALLKAGQNAEAEAVYREDLKRFPENGWSLFGLAAALRAQGKSAEAAAVDQRFSKAWSAADVKLTASRF